MMKYLNHDDPNLTVKVIDIDAPGTGRIPRTLIRPYAGRGGTVDNALAGDSDQRVRSVLRSELGTLTMSISSGKARGPVIAIGRVC